jgi:hypothetical protein
VITFEQLTNMKILAKANDAVEEKGFWLAVNDAV